MEKDEMELILHKEFTIERLRQVREVFIFCAFTGLAFTDVKHSNLSILSKGKDGEVWYASHGRKQRICVIYLCFKFRLMIINKYRDNYDAKQKGFFYQYCAINT